MPHSIASWVGFLPVALATLLAFASSGAAQTPPNQGLVVRDGSLGTAPLVVSPGVDPLGQHADYLIAPELGEQRGRNLFHSFDRFGIGTGETATFTGPDPIDAPQTVENVISRVTGGEASNVDGTLRSTIPGADVYLLNPLGLLFGPNARLDLPGSFHASTADSLGFDTGEVFEARAGGAVPLLQVASPQAFGFLSANEAPILVGALRGAGNASIEIRGAGDVVIDGPVGGGTRSVAIHAGRDVEITNGGSITRGEEGIVLVEGGEDVTIRGSVSTDGGSITVRGAQDVSISGSVAAPSGDIGVHGGHGVTISGSVDASVSSVGEFFGYPAGRVTVETDGGSVLVTGSLRARGRDGVISVPEDEVRTRGSVTRDDPLGGEPEVVPWRIEGGEFVHYWISPELGWIPPSSESGEGADLFHSFHRFDLAPGEVAVFANPERLPLERVFGRVTGGAASLLGAMPRSESEVYLANPAGLELEGGLWVGSRSFRASTADFLGFADGQVFEARSGGAVPQRAVALPVEFGFSPTNSAPIVVEGALRAFGGSIELRGGGDVEIRASIDVRNRFRFDGVGDAGDIAIHGGRDVEIDGSLDASSISGTAGTVVVDAGRDVTIRGPVAAINGGDVAVHGGRDVAIRGSIDTSGFAETSGGSVTVHGGTSVALDGSLTASADGWGHAGSVALESSGTISISGLGPAGLGSFVSADGYGAADAGIVTLRGGAVRLSSPGGPDQSGIVSAEGLGGSNAGQVVIHAGELVLDGGGIFVQTDTAGTRAGEVRLEVRRLLVTGDSQISASSFLGTAGTVIVRATESVVLSNPGGDPFLIGRYLQNLVEGEPLSGAPTGIFSAVLFGVEDSGAISISAPRVEVTDGAIVAVASVGGGRGGEIVIDADRVLVTRGGAIDSSSLLTGPGGSIRITARESVTVSGTGIGEYPSRIRTVSVSRADAGSIEISAPEVLVDGGVIASTTGGIGAAGEVRVLADLASVRGGGLVDSSSFGPGAGGTVLLLGLPAADASGLDDPREAQRIEVSGEESRVSARAAGAGEGGDLVLYGAAIDVSDGGSVATESAFDGEEAGAIFRDLIAGDFYAVPPDAPPAGRGGSIRLQSSGDVTLRRGSLSARAEGSGRGGDVEVLAGRLSLSEGSLLEARSEGPSDAGSVAISAGRLLLDGSRVTVEAAQASGGNVGIELEDALHSMGSSITASVTSGSGGNVAIGPAASGPGPVFVILEGSEVVARASQTGGFGGHITITADALVADSESAIDASALGGAEFGGTVEIDAPDTDVTSEITSLPESLLDASALLAERCSARRTAGGGGSFVVSGRQGLPAAPEGLLPVYSGVTEQVSSESLTWLSAPPSIDRWLSASSRCN